jgi:hypothetical protein
MLVTPTDRWINSIAVPNNGVIQKPRNKKQANVSDYVGQWLIDGGYAIGDRVPTVGQPKQPDDDDVSIPDVVTPPPAVIPIADEPIQVAQTKPKKAALKPFVLEQNS